MYCKKCGKFIGTDEDLCYECKSVELMEEKPAQATPQFQPAYAPQPKLEPKVERAGNVMTGFGKALAGTIVGFFVYIFGAAAVELAIRSGFTSGFFLLWSLSVAGGVISLVFGIQSIKVFKREKRAGRKPPVPALVLGIVSTALAGFTLVFCLLAIISALSYVPYDYDPFDGYYY